MTEVDGSIKFLNTFSEILNFTFERFKDAILLILYYFTN